MQNGATSSQTSNKDATVKADSSQLVFRNRFSSRTKSPLNEIEWEKRDVGITDDSGRVIFEQKDVEVPRSWSQMAATIVASKYFHGEPGSSTRESSVRQLISRITETISGWGEAQNYFANPDQKSIFHDELCSLLVNQIAAFNSPVWFNVGVQPQPQCSACFIISVNDTMESLLELQAIEGRLFKYGSGTGTNLSAIRASREKLGGGGKPSGPVSFMRAYDGWASVIKSGGKTRRAAKMQILNVDHPDIVEFVRAKSEEEKKAWALIEMGYDGNFNAPGGAYESVAFQNANLSVRVSDHFMNAVLDNERYWTRRVTDGEKCEELEARSVLRMIAEGTHLCGDPGLQFDDTINRWHTCPAAGRINASNPCSEYMHLDNSACNLSSINLLKFLDSKGEFRVEEFINTVTTLIGAQDMLVDNSSYPLDRIGKCAHKFRQLGLGYANLGALLMNLGLPYDSARGRGWAAAITALMTGAAYAASARLASRLGAFEGFARNRKPMLKVVEMHREAAYALSVEDCPVEVLEAARVAWDEALKLGEQFGFRNSQVTVLAPTGTISFMMDCDTTGIEPEISLIKYKKLAGGGYLKIVNGSVANALARLGYDEQQRASILEYIDSRGTVEGAPGFKDEHLAVFDCALRPANGKRMIHYLGHVKMMAAAQPFLSGAISKTVNLPSDTSVEEIFDIYIKAWEMGLKAIALYRDGSKRTQPLSESKGRTEVVRKPVRRRLPDERRAVTHKFSIAGLEGYLTVGLYEDGSPGEIFIVVAKEGSTLSGVMDAFATSISMALQYGVPLLDLVRKFAHMRFEPSGFTNNKDLPMAKSIVDYVFRWMGMKFLSPEQRVSLGLSSGAEDMTVKEKTNGNPVKFSGQPAHQENSGKAPVVSSVLNIDDAPPCLVCGSGLMVRAGACYVCLNCGAQGGCS